MSEYYVNDYIIKRNNRKLLSLSIFFSGLTVFILFLGIYVYTGYTSGKTANTFLSPLGDPIIKVVEEIADIVFPINALAVKNFDKDINEYSIVVKNLKTGQIYTSFDDKRFIAASLYKIWVMGTIYGLIAEGKVLEDQAVAGSFEDLSSRLGSSSSSAVLGAETNSDGDRTVAYTVENAIESMITVSDNYAALLLASRSGTKNIVTFLDSYGLKDSTFGQPPKTTAADIAEILEQIYEGKVVNKETSLKMIEVLKRQKLNDRIPKYLPDDVAVAHKTGELDYVKHDAGIVFTKKGDYIIVVLSETDNPKVAAEKIAKFSKDVYDYFETNLN